MKLALVLALFVSTQLWANEKGNAAHGGNKKTIDNSACRIEIEQAGHLPGPAVEKAQEILFNDYMIVKSSGDVKMTISAGQRYIRTYFADTMYKSAYDYGITVETADGI